MAVKQLVKNLDERLFDKDFANQDEDKHKEDYKLNKTHFVTQYQILIDQAQKLGERRQSSHTFFSTLHTFILSALGFSSKGIFLETQNLFLTSILIILGVAMAYSWMSILNRYRDMNFTYYNLIKRFEEHMPAHLFTVFYDITSGYDNEEKNNLIANKEIIIPKALIFGYLCYGIGVIGAHLLY